MRASDRQVGQDEELATWLVGSVTNAWSIEEVGSTRGEEEDDIGLEPHWTLAESCRECGGMIDVWHFSAMAVDGD